MEGGMEGGMEEGMEGRKLFEILKLRNDVLVCLFECTHADTHIRTYMLLCYCLKHFFFCI